MEEKVLLRGSIPLNIYSSPLPNAHLLDKKDALNIRSHQDLDYYAQKGIQI